MVNQNNASYHENDSYPYPPAFGQKSNLVKNETQQSSEAIIVDNNSVDMFAGDNTLSGVKSDAL